MKYAVRTNRSGKYLQWCDSHWYGSVPMPLYIFTLDEAREACKNMSKHYNYNLDIIDESGEVVENINWLTKKVTRKRTAETPVIPKPQVQTAKKFQMKGNSLAKAFSKFGRLK